MCFSQFSLCLSSLPFIFYFYQKILRNAVVFLWMFAGIIAVTTATASLSALGKFIEDRVAKNSEDLLITKRQLAYSYRHFTYLLAKIHDSVSYDAISSLMKRSMNDGCASTYEKYVADGGMTGSSEC